MSAKRIAGSRKAALLIFALLAALCFPLDT
jgi:hypothetical protein